MLDQHRVNAEEETLRQRVRDLPDAARARFYSEAGERLRDPDTYAVLNFSLICGIHQLYLRRYALWLFELLLGVLGIVLGLNFLNVNQGRADRRFGIRPIRTGIHLWSHRTKRNWRRVAERV